MENNPLLKKLDDLDHWYDSALGQSVFAAVAQHVSQQVNEAKPDYLLQVGCRSFYQKVCDPKQVFIHLDPRKNLCSNGLNVCCEFDRIPLISDSFPMVICPHVHEMVRNPRELFGELSRVVEADGYLVLIGVNMTSLWGVEHLMGRLVKPQWTKRIHSLRTLIKSLNRCDFELTAYETVCFNPYTFKLPVSVNQFMESMGRRYWPRRGAIEILWLQKKELACVLEPSVGCLG